MVLKRESLGSLREKFLIHGRRFVPGRNWGENLWIKKLKCLIFVYSTHQKTTQRGWFRWKCLQQARTNCFNCSGWLYKSFFVIDSCLLFLHNAYRLWNFCNYIFLWLFGGRNWRCLDLQGGNMKKDSRTTELEFLNTSKWPPNTFVIVWQIF